MVAYNQGPDPALVRIAIAVTKQKAIWEGKGLFHSVPYNSSSKTRRAGTQAGQEAGGRS